MIIRTPSQSFLHNLTHTTGAKWMSVCGERVHPFNPPKGCFEAHIGAIGHGP